MSRMGGFGTNMKLEEVKERYINKEYKNTLQLRDGNKTITILEIVYQFANSRVIGFIREDNQLAEWFESKIYYKALKEPRFNLKGKAYNLSSFRKPELKLPLQPVKTNYISKARQLGSGW